MPVKLQFWNLSRTIPIREIFLLEVNHLLLLRLWNYVRGYVIIIVEGYFIEKFINICTSRRILLWDIRVHKDRLVTMRLSIEGFKKIRPVARKTKCRVSILKKVGLPFILNRYRNRKAFFIGGIIFIVLMFVLTSFIWSIEINGNQELPAERIEEVLAENGIKTGVLKYKIDTEAAVTDILLELGDIVWASIDVRGTKVKVELRERVKTPEIVPRNVPCDIVAVKDGFIKQVIAKQGIEAVGEGDTVKKGQILISGRIPLKGKEGEFRLVHAMGTVYARTWYEEREPVVTERVERIPTGKVINDYAVILFNKKVDILKKKNKFKDFSFQESRKQLSIGEYFVFPVELITKSYHEEQVEKTFINEEVAKHLAVESAYRKLTEQVPENAEIVKKNVNFVKGKDDSLIAEVIFECVEDIGTTRKIGGK